MRIVFMGSAPISCVSLAALLAEDAFQVVAAVTQPDRARGRRLQVQDGPVKSMALAADIPVHAPERVNTRDSVELIRGFAPDVIAVIAYGQILKRDLLQLAPAGCVNVHTSLLPKYRGAAPIQWAVAHGNRESGVTTMQMDRGMDTGDILLQTPVAIGPEDSAGDLHDALALEGARLLVRTLHALHAGTLLPRPQVEADASYAPKMSKADGRIDWAMTASEIHDRVRGFYPWPGSSCVIPGEGKPDTRMLKVHQVRVVEGEGEPGSVIDVSTPGGPIVAAGAGAVQLLAVQPAGRKTMSGDDFLRGHAMQVGERMQA